jgi:hypothetical protein
LIFLRAVYPNEGLPLSVRMKAAIEAAPNVHPKLSAVAVVNGDDFGARRYSKIAQRLIEVTSPPTE